MRRLVISRDAETDLILLWVYYAEQSERASERIRAEISARYDLLLEFPHLGRLRNELQAGLRSFPVGNHIVFYCELNDGIEIVRVLHGAQDTFNIFSPDAGEDSQEN